MSQRLDTRTPAYQQKCVYAEELRTKCSKLARRLMNMAWPDTPTSTLHRLSAESMSFSSETKPTDNAAKPTNKATEPSNKATATLTTIVMDITVRRHDDIEDPEQRGFMTVIITTEETAADTLQHSIPKVIDARIKVKQRRGDFGTGASTIIQAVMQLDYRNAVTDQEYEDFLRTIEGKSSSAKESELLHRMLQTKSYLG